jgi:hypothetical protein
MACAQKKFRHLPFLVSASAPCEAGEGAEADLADQDYRSAPEIFFSIRKYPDYPRQGTNVYQYPRCELCRRKILLYLIVIIRPVLELS